MRVELAGDGWRYRVPCMDGCGAGAVVIVEYVRTGARCMDCGRRYWGAPVPERPEPGWTRYNGLRLGQGGENCYPAAIVRREGAVSLRKTRVIRSMQVFAFDPDVPPAARELAKRVGGLVLLSVARRTDSPTTAAGKPSANWSKIDTYVSVQWREGGRPPTRMAIWKNGTRSGAMIGELATSHTAIGAL